MTRAVLRAALSSFGMDAPMVQRFRRRARGRRRRRVSFAERYRKPLQIALAVVVSVSVLGTGYAVLLNSKFSNILTFSTDDIKNRPDPDKGRSLNVLVLGADK